jgi:DNA-binding CsgD family transcriptional regulator
MQNMLLFFYYLSAYSLGLVALVSSASMLRSGADAAWFFASTLSMTFTVLFGTIQNFVGPAAGGAAATALTLANYLTAAVFSVSSVRFFDAVIPWRGARIADAAVLAASASLYALAAADIVMGRRGWWADVLLIAKNAACLYWAVLALAGRQRAAGPFREFSRRIAVICACALPFMALTEIPFLRASSPAYLGSIGIKGPWILPGIYIVWCLTFLLRRPARGAAAAGPVPAAGPATLAEFSSGLGISQREREVMELLVVGKSYKEIMGILSISMPTVKTHVSSLYRKTGATNRLDLARRAGLLPHTKE